MKSNQCNAIYFKFFRFASGKDKWLLVDKKIKKPTALSVFGGNILFANSRRNSIESVDKSYGTNRTVLKEEQPEVTGFSVYHPSHQPCKTLID